MSGRQDYLASHSSRWLLLPIIPILHKYTLKTAVVFFKTAVVFPKTAAVFEKTAVVFGKPPNVLQKRPFVCINIHANGYLCTIAWAQSTKKTFHPSAIRVSVSPQHTYKQSITRNYDGWWIPTKIKTGNKSLFNLSFLISLLISPQERGRPRPPAADCGRGRTRSPAKRREELLFFRSSLLASLAKNSLKLL